MWPQRGARQEEINDITSIMSSEGVPQRKGHLLKIRVSEQFKDDVETCARHCDLDTSQFVRLVLAEVVRKHESGDFQITDIFQS